MSSLFSGYNYMEGSVMQILKKGIQSNHSLKLIYNISFITVYATEQNVKKYQILGVNQKVKNTRVDNY